MEIRVENGGLREISNRLLAPELKFMRGHQFLKCRSEKCWGAAVDISPLKRA